MIPIEKNREYTACITAMSSDGNGIARIDGYTVFVPQTVKGDTVRFLAVKTKSSYGYGKLIEIISPSADRCRPVCPSFGVCGGCQLMHMTYRAQLAFKEDMVKNHLLRIGGFSDVNIEPIIGMEEPYYYRNKMSFPAGQDDGHLISGFYAPHSHRVIPTAHCLLGSDEMMKIVGAVWEYARKIGVCAYDETNHTGCIRRIFVREGYRTEEIMAVVSANSADVRESHVLIDCIRAASERVSSIIWNVNTEKTNPGLGQRNITLWGKDYIEDQLCGVRYRISPNSFFQVNPAQTERLYQKAICFAGLTGCETVMDLYCGIGTISLACARYAKRVIGVETVKQAVEDARCNAVENKIDNAVFYDGSAERIVPQLIADGESPDVVILDPPRKGSDEITLGAIAQAQPKKIVYVSCDSATLSRDLRYLRERGYQIENAALFDMFPQTVHVETVVSLSK